MTLFLMMGAPFFLALGLCRGVIALNISDAPDGGRKQQSAPVPSAGGIAIILALGLSAFVFGLADGMTLDRVFGALERWRFWPLIGFGVGVAVIGLIDDIKPMPAKAKFGLMVALSLQAATFGPQLTSVWLPGLGDTDLAPWFAIPGVALWLFVMANVVNFIDGANGIAMGSSLVMCLGAAALFVFAQILASQATPEGAAFLLAVMLAGSLAGFLVWNLSGYLYAGDIGALFVGAVLGVFGLLMAQGSVWLGPLLMLPFLVDVFLTMAWRARKGENIMTPHTDHAYQLLIRAGWKHWKVSTLWWVFSVICAAAAFFALQSGDLERVSFWLFLVCLAAGCALWVWQRVTLGRRVSAAEQQSRLSARG